MLPDGVTPMELYRAPEGVWINDRFIPAGAAKLLEDNPALASQFNAQYGAGLAETLLANREDKE